MESSEKNQPAQGNDEDVEKVTERLLVTNEIQPPVKLPYPKRVFLILGNEFCERFNYYGMRTILALYLRNKLGYSENDATILYHGSAMLNSFMCIFGGILSDVWWGKFKTIFILSIVYALGSTIVSISSIPTLNLPPRTLLIVGLVFIAVGAGGIKPCVSAFGADQFKLPEQKAQIATFFSLFYASINMGAFLTHVFTPILRSDVHCFEQNDCYPLAFGVPAILMLIAIAFFLAGIPFYTYEKISSENMLVQVTKCITNAITTKVREGRTRPRKNLLDYSIEKYGDQLVQDTRILLNILVLYLPLPIFWSLFDQVGSRWTFQADRMNGDIGFYTIKPDQISMINPFLVMGLIPFFEICVYPLLSRIGIGRPLQKMVLGGILTAISFVISAMVEFKIEASPPNSISMLWLIPQYVIITIAEVMFNVTGYAFSYEQAPERMKSVVQALWLLTMSFGNLLLLVIVKLSFFESHAHEFLLFVGIMSIDLLVFIYLAHNFKSRKI